MMKLKKITRIGKEPAKTEKPKETPKKSLPPDTYKEELEPKEIVVDDSRKIIVSVKRGGDLGLVCADIRQYQTTQTFTGFTKKGINIPLEVLVELKAVIQDVIEECEDKNLFGEDE